MNNSKYKFSFEKLKVWQDAVRLTRNIYMLTQKLPQNEIYGLTSQMRRAAISISSNIAEGAGRSSFKEQVRFSETAYSSLMEVLSHLMVTVELGYFEEDCLETLRPSIEEIAREINALKKSQKRRINEEQLIN